MTVEGKLNPKNVVIDKCDQKLYGAFFLLNSELTFNRFFFCRPTMIKYGINNIRDLVGHKVNLQMVYDNPICRINK